MLPLTGPEGTRRNKPATRQSLLAKRDRLTERERADKSEVICLRAAVLLAGKVAGGEVIALYANKGSEVETHVLDRDLRAAGFRIAYPRVEQIGRELAFFETTIDALVPTRWGLREPAGDGARIAIGDIAAFVVPGLAFDRQGGRVGWGKGHYDATLAVARAHVLTIGLAFECQMTDGVPHEPHDIALGAIITEA